MSTFDVKHNREEAFDAHNAHTLSTDKIGAENEPRIDSTEGDAEEMPSTIHAQPGACAAVLALADDDRLTATQWRVFGLIGKGYQKRADMAAIMKKEVVTIARAISKLVSLGLIDRETVPGKPSKLRISGRIIDAARILNDTTSHITDDTSITKDTATRITDDTAHTDDTGQSVDNPASACIGTGARADKLTFNTTSSDLIGSDLIEPPSRDMIAALVKRVGEAGDPTKGGLIHGGDLTRFLRGGCTWEDIEFAADKLAASFRGRGKRFSTWSLLEEHAIEIRNRRLAGLPAPTAPVPFVRRQAGSNSGGYRSNGIRPMVALG